LEFIDNHFHVDARTYEDMVEISKKGVRALVAPSYALLPTYDAKSILTATDNLIGMIGPTYDRFFIKVFVAVGLNMLLIPKDYEKVLEKLPEYIQEFEEVVSIGEVGIDPKDPQKLGFPSKSALQTSVEVQTEILKEEMRIGKKFSIPVDCHTPSQFGVTQPLPRVDYAEKYLELADEVGLPRDLLIIDHADEDIVKVVYDSGAYIGITVRNELTPECAAKIVGKYGVNKIIVNSDAAPQPWASNPSAVPDTAFAMKRYGISDEDIRKATFENALNLYKLKL